MSTQDYTIKIQAIREVTSLFRLERLVYIAIIVTCLIILIIAIAVAMVKGEIGTTEIASMMGSGGTITIMTGRLLHMWNKAMQMLDPTGAGKEAGDDK